MQRTISFFGIILLLLFLGCVGPNGEPIQNLTNETNVSDGVEINNTIANDTADDDLDNGSEDEIDNFGNVTLNETGNNITPENAAENGEIGQIENKTLEGLVFGGGKYILVLDDLSLDKPQSCAIVSIYDYETQENLQQAKICPGEEYYWVAPDGHKFRIVVIETAPGYSYGAAWANIIIYG